MTARVSAMARRDAETLLDLARRVRRLVPCWHDPSRFYRERDAIEHALAGLAISVGALVQREGPRQ